MGISEEKMKIVIDNYFRSECDVNTSIKSAFEKGFRIGVIKGQSAQSDLQPTCNQVATDCISRKAAIDTIAHTILFNEFLRAEEAIKNLPTVQPTQITQVNSNESLDCISRQQAINAVIDELDMIDHVPQWVFKKLEGRLKKLPAVQPEIIRCKDCKKSTHWYRDRRRCFLWHEEGIDVFKDGFCNYAERRDA